MAPQRVLAAVVFTDTVGFTKRTGENEEEAFSLLSVDFALMRQLAAAYEGQVKKSTGDGLLMVFQSAMQAVSCAVEIQRRLGEAAKQNPRALKHRIGIHLGDVFLSEDDVVGDGVNVANRLQGEAQPGAICLSQTVYDIVKTKLPIQAKPLGERQLKNVKATISIYEIPPLFAPRASQRTPSIHRSPKAPQRSNGGIIAAIIFAGFCVLGGAVILATRGSWSAAAPPENVPSRSTATDGAGSQKPKDSATKTDAGSDSPKDEHPPVKEDRSPIANAQELASLVPENSDARAAYESARQQFKPVYQFEDMLKWLDSQAWIGESNGRRLRGHWERLKEFREGLLAGLAKASQAEPLKVDEDTYYLSGATIVYAQKSQNPVQLELAQLPAVNLLAMAKALGLSEPILTAFQLEYELG